VANLVQEVYIEVLKRKGFKCYWIEELIELFCIHVMIKEGCWRWKLCCTTSSCLSLNTKQS